MRLGQVAVVKHGQTLEEARLQVDSCNYFFMQVYAIEEGVAFWQVNKWGEAYDFKSETSRPGYFIT